MAWNQLRVSLLSPGRDLLSEGSCPAVLYTEGEPSIIDPKTIKLILFQEGFVISKEDKRFIILEKERIEAFIVLEKGFVVEIILSFQLPNDESWQKLIDKIIEPTKMILLDRKTLNPILNCLYLRLDLYERQSQI